MNAGPLLLVATTCLALACGQAAEPDALPSRFHLVPLAADGAASASGDGCFGPEDASALGGTHLITCTRAANAPGQRAYLAALGFRPRAGNRS